MNLHETLGEALLASSKIDSHLDFINGPEDQHRVSVADLYETALGVLFHIQQAGVKPGDELILFTNNNEQFVDGFWACILGGIIPVPVAVGLSDEHRLKLLRIFRQLNNPRVYTEKTQLRRLIDFAETQNLLTEFNDLFDSTMLVDDITDISTHGQVHASMPDDLAFIQFSSGSTSTPKGVLLTHRNVLVNARGIRDGAQLTRQDIGLSWMPLTHDMGLICMHMAMLIYSIDHAIMDTRLFSRRPLYWLLEASKRRSSILSSPNFGYKHFLKVFESKGLDDLDLSCVRVIYNGAEPISVPLCERFMDQMAPYGLDRRAMMPVYGLAEATVGVSNKKPGQPYRTVTLNRHTMRIGAPVEYCAAGDTDGIEMMVEGFTLRDCELRIADDHNRELPESHIGHVHIRGPNVTSGYLNVPPEEQPITADGWFDTGDLGLINQGELVITGRFKEIIFVNGENYYPYDIEYVAEQLDEVELGKIAVAGARKPGSDEDELVMFILHRGDLEEFVAHADHIRRYVTEHTALEIGHVVPVSKIPKTTSGKVQRHLLTQDYEQGMYDTAIQEMDNIRRTLHSDDVLEGSALELKIKKIFSGVVRDRAIGLDDDFFDFGINSLALAEIHEQIDELMPNLLDVEDFFAHTSIRALAAYLSEKQAASQY
jgi:acyl-CoA synthetase (AMP-forming)/AMP-acid ligase II